MRTNGFKLIGRIGQEYYFCDSVFDHGDGFQGATGTVVRPVSPEEWEWASDPENVKERHHDVYCEMTGRDGYDVDDDDPDFSEWIDSMIRYDGIACAMFDESDCCDAEDAFDDLGLEYECTDCTGGGRIFAGFAGRPEFDEVYDRKALVAIQALEDGAVTAEYAAKVVFRQQPATA